MGHLKRIGIIAPSFVVPQYELSLSVAKLREARFEVEVHPQVRRKNFLFAGSDDERLQAWLDWAWSDRFDIIWCARGGYGGARLLPLLEAETIRRGVPPRKLLVGYSDPTVLLDYVRTRWGWSALHAPMPGGREFLQIRPAEWKRLLAWISGTGVQAQSPRGIKLTAVNDAAREVGTVSGPLFGGNLAMVASVLGTPFQGKHAGGFLFLEDVGEPWYRIDRMLVQLEQAGAMKGVKGVILGSFSGCTDRVASVLRPGAPVGRAQLEKPKPKDLVPLRPLVPDARAFREIFSAWADRLGGLPVWKGVNAGHAHLAHESLPLGAQARLEKTTTGYALRFLSWG